MVKKKTAKPLQTEEKSWKSIAERQIEFSKHYLITVWIFILQLEHS